MGRVGHEPKKKTLHVFALRRASTWHAPVQVFQVVSLDGWQQVMWHTQDAAGEETWIFFVVVLVIGNAILVSVSELYRQVLCTTQLKCRVRPE